MEHPYVTYENTFIESEWWALKKIWEKGLLYKALRLYLTVPAAGRRCPLRKWHRAIRL